MHTWDVVVIGSGVAGSAAALAAAARGAAVALVEGRPGATALCNGSWRGPVPAPLAAALREAGYDLEPATRTLFSPDGSLLQADYAASTHLTAPADGPTVVCGVSGLTGFHARTLVRMWTDLVDRELRAEAITLPGTPAGGWSPAALCHLIQQDLTVLGSALHALGTRTGAGTIVLPALLGLNQVSRLRATLEHIAGCRVVEALGSVPSIPGWRLQRALRIALEQAGVHVVAGLCVGPKADRSSVRSIRVQREGQTEEVSGRRFVLATGKFVGGGISADRAMKESALDLPVWIDHLNERFEMAEPLTQTNADRLAEQPILSLGVAHDEEGRPTNGSDLVYANVWAAGAVRRGQAHTLGRAASEGWSAGERAAA